MIIPSAYVSSLLIAAEWDSPMPTSLLTCCLFDIVTLIVDVLSLGAGSGLTPGVIIRLA